jgi:hypothetical protein
LVALSDLEASEYEHWVSTRSAFVLLTCWAEYRRKDVDKQNALTALLWFVESVLQPDDACALEAGVIHPDPAAACDTMLDLEGKCKCVRTLECSLDIHHVSPQKKIAHVLRHSFERRDCLVCAHHFKRVVSAIASTVDSTVETWATSDIVAMDLSLSGLSGKKKRRLDVHAIQQVLSNVGESGGRAMQALACTSLKSMYRHVHKVMGSFMASSIMSFCPVDDVSCGTLCSIWDAVRIGSPAWELLLHVVRSSEKK